MHSTTAGLDSAEIVSQLRAAHAAAPDATAAGVDVVSGGVGDMKQVGGGVRVWWVGRVGFGVRVWWVGWVVAGQAGRQMGAAGPLQKRVQAATRVTLMTRSSFQIS